MAFDTQTVTIKGAELLAAATAQDKLIIVGCDATQTYLTQAQAVNVATRPATPFSTTTSVTQLGSTAEHINSRVYFRAGDNTGGDANTLMLYGHKQSAPNDDYVIFVASAQTPFHLPEVGDVVDEWETALDITYNIATDAVGYATQATYCTLSEFNLLKERTVTTHEEGYPTTGENQTIYGDKVFEDQILCSSPRGIIWKGTAANSIWVLLNYYGVTIFDSSSNEICSMDATNGTISTTGKFSAVSSGVTSEFSNVSISGNARVYGLFQADDVGLSGALQVAGFARFNDGCGVDDGITINSGGLEISETGLTSDWEFKAVVSYNAVGPVITFGFPNYSGSGNVPEIVMTGDTLSKIELNAENVIVGISGYTGNALTVNGNVTITGHVTANATGQNMNCYIVNVDRALFLFGSSSFSKLDNDGLAIHNGSTAQANNRILYASTGDNKTIIGNSTNDSALEINGTLSTTKAATLGAVGNEGTILNVNGMSNFTKVVTIGVSGDTGNRLYVYGTANCSGPISVGGATIGGNTTITGNLTASTSGTTATFNDVVINGTISAAGLAPNLSSSTISIPIGGIVGIYAVGNGNMGTITVGQSKTISANQFKPCRWDVDSGAWTEDQYYVPAGTYKALTGFVDSINAGTAGPVFFIRVA